MNGTNQTAQQNYIQFVAKSESGMLSWGAVFGVLVLIVSFAFVGNSFETVNKKVETQNTADAVAYSSSVWLARGMNAVTATNHIIGELNGIYVLHHALGGVYLDNHSRDRKTNDTDELERLNQRITSAINFEFSFNVFIGKIIIRVVQIEFKPKRFVPLPRIKVPPKRKVIDSWSLIKTLCGTPKPMDMHKDTIVKNPIADRNSTIYECKRDLKDLYGTAIMWHVVGGVLDKFGPLVPYVGMALKYIGIAIKWICYGLEWSTYAQYKLLDIVEGLALKSAGMKKAIPIVISGLHLYQKGEVYARAPLQAFRSADSVAKHNFSDADGLVRGDIPDGLPKLSIAGVADQLTKFFPRLPIERETTKDESRSQLLRATYPWVAYWRRLPMKLFDWTRVLELKIPWPFNKRYIFHCKFHEYYRKWTNIYARQACEWLRFEKSNNKNRRYKEMLTVENMTISGGYFNNRDDNAGKGRDIRLFVMSGLNNKEDRFGKLLENKDKTQEPWNEPTLKGSLEADRLFCLIGFAQRPKSPVITNAVFRQENPNGFVCYSQAMIYNANEQKEPTDWNGQGEEQIVTGWDTLNWYSWPKTETPLEWTITNKDMQVSTIPPGISNWKRAGRSREMHNPPGVKLNWQAKLTPLTARKMLVVISTQTLFSGIAGNEDMSSILMNNREAQLFLQNH